MNVLYTKTAFLLSAPGLDRAPPDEGCEIAFAGRSNAGKSSAINAMTGRKSLARTSKTPGRTRHLVFFRVDAERRLVDLPGYGYARVSAAVQRQWHNTLDAYFSRRRSLRGVMLFMDIRRPLTDFDWRMVEWCAGRGRPLHIVLTKADKLGRGAAKSVLLETRKILAAAEVPPFSMQLFSATRRIGVDEAHAVMDRWLNVAGMAAREGD